MWSKCRIIHPRHWSAEGKLVIDHAILRHLDSTYVIEKPFSFTSIINEWSALQRKFSSPRNHLWVPYMGLGQQLRHRQALVPLIPLIPWYPFLRFTPSRMGLQAHKSPLASVWVFSFALRILKYTELLLSCRAPMIWESLPRFPLWRSVIFDL